jgi:hypothetical protein
VLRVASTRERTASNVAKFGSGRRLARSEEREHFEATPHVRDGRPARYDLVEWM